MATQDIGTEWYLWGTLTLGAGLAGLGLLHSTGKYRQWRHLREAQEGEILPGDEVLEIGQIAEVGSVEEQRPVSSFVPVRIVARSRGLLTLQTEIDALPGEKQSTFRLLVGREVSVIVTTEQGLYRFTTRIRDVRTSEATRSEQEILVVNSPLWLVHVQRRQHVRIETLLPASFESAESENRSAIRARQSTDHPLHGTITNLSAGGLRAEIGGVMGVQEAADILKTFAPGTVLKVRLPLPALSNSPMLVRVRESERVAVRGGIGVRIASTFLSMTPWEQELIIQHIFRMQREKGQSRRRAS